MIIKAFENLTEKDLQEMIDIPTPPSEFIAYCPNCRYPHKFIIGLSNKKCIKSLQESWLNKK